jgi:signal-transduction protein with cAMP-binding, CBS, and nucleotidyltransferase domain
MRGSELNKIIDCLVENFTPLNQLPKERIPEIADASRIIKLQKGENFQLENGTNGDYLFLLKGHLDLMLPTGAISLINSDSSTSLPFVLPSTAYPGQIDFPK